MMLSPTIAHRALEKVALMERLVRLGATDIPNTPRLLMRHRSPGELAALQGSVSQQWNKRVTDPLMRKANLGLSKLPQGKLKSIAEGGARIVAQDPLGAAITNVLPVPGAFAAYTAGKRGLERVIDRLSPLAGASAAIRASAV